MDWKAVVGMVCMWLSRSRPECITSTRRNCGVIAPDVHTNQCRFDKRICLECADAELLWGSRMDPVAIFDVGVICSVSFGPLLTQVHRVPNAEQLPDRLQPLRMEEFAYNQRGRKIMDLLLRIGRQLGGYVRGTWSHRCP